MCIRDSVNAIGTAVFAAFVGGGGLGGSINRGIRIQDMRLILTGTGCLMIIAVLADSLLGWLERQARRSRGGSRKMWIPVAGLLVCFLLLLPYGRTSVGDLSPVSYTHLDVYKRQEYDCQFWEAYCKDYAAGWFIRYEILESPLYEDAKEPCAPREKEV